MPDWNDPDRLDELALYLFASEPDDFVMWLDRESGETPLLDPGEDPTPPERFTRVPTGEQLRLRDFVGWLRDSPLAAVVSDAMRGGPGAFRRVRAALERRGAHGRFEEWRTEAQREAVRDWLRAEGLLPDPA